MDGLAAEAAVPKTVIIDATYLEAHRTAVSLRCSMGADAGHAALDLACIIVQKLLVSSNCQFKQDG